MKRLMPYIIVGLLLVAMPAQDQAFGQWAIGNSVPNAAFVSQEGTVVMMAAMKDNMDHMQTQMDRIREAKNPGERERLVQDHIQLMTWQMEMMKHARGEGMLPGEMVDANHGASPTPNG